MAETANLIRATENFPQVLVTGHLTTSEATQYQCPTNHSVAIATATLCNTSGTDRTVYLSVVKAGTSAGNSNRVAIVDLQPGESCIVEELVGLLLGPLDKISGYASAGSSVSLVLSGAVSS